MAENSGDTNPKEEPPRRGHFLPETAPFNLRQSDPGAKPVAETQANQSEPLGATREFGRYQILKLLGQGGMGWVYLAEDSQLQRRVALKVPRISQFEQSDALERFLREARTAATLRHPNICPVYDIGEFNRIRFITMGFISGPSLAELVGTPKLRDHAFVASLVRKIAMALVAAHEKGIIHRDLKPANILMDEKGDPIVTDFGLARTTENSMETKLTQEGMIVGTPAYMSPEQVLGEHSKIGPRSDIYSLGVIFYELLTSRVPYTGPVTVVLSQIIRGSVTAPKTFVPDVDARLEAICLKMMAHDLDARYSSASEVVEDLGNWLNKGSTGGAFSGAWPWVAGAAAAVLLMAGVLTLLLRNDSPSPPKSPAGPSGVAVVDTAPPVNSSAENPPLRFSNDNRILLAPGETIDLLANVDLMRDVVGNDVAGRHWSRDGNQLVSPFEERRIGRIMLPFKPPVEYEMNAVVQRMSGTDGVMFGLVVDGHTCTIGFDFYFPRICGIALVDGKDLPDNESVVRRTVMQDNAPHAIKIVVKKNSVRALVDGKLVVNWSGDPNRLSAFQEVPDMQKMWFGTAFSQFKFVKMEIKLPDNGL